MFSLTSQLNMPFLTRSKSLIGLNGNENKHTRVSFSLDISRKPFWFKRRSPSWNVPLAVLKVQKTIISTIKLEIDEISKQILIHIDSYNLINNLLGKKNVRTMIKQVNWRNTIFMSDIWKGKNVKWIFTWQTSKSYTDRKRGEKGGDFLQEVCDSCFLSRNRKLELLQWLRAPHDKLFLSRNGFHSVLH